MSLCQKCLKDSKKHTEKQWVTHQEELKQANNVKCNLCQKKKGAHSESLWDIHKSVILKAMLKTRHKKLWVIQQGLGLQCPALLDNEFRDQDGMNPTEWLVPIYMECRSCGHFVGDSEMNMADILGKMCLKCFCEETNQEYNWWDVPK